MISDGCTAWVLSEWLNSIEPVNACCVVHDAEYVLQIGKGIADWNLFSCVTQAGFPVLGALMTITVGVLGGFYYNRDREKQ